MTLTTILIIILILILLGAIPAWPHSRGWGYGPSGIVGVDGSRKFALKTIRLATSRPTDS